MAEIDIDTSDVNASQPPTGQVPSAQVRTSTIIAMILIIGAFALVALFANIQSFRRNRIEAVRVTPAVTTTPGPR